MNLQTQLQQAREQLLDGLSLGIVPFWRERALDVEHGGYFTEFDGDGRLAASSHDKFIVTQTRLIWAFSSLARFAHDPDDLLRCARHGVDFLASYFLDHEHGGWRWCVSRNGTPLDHGKLVYGQSFALYALSAYARASGERRAGELASQTFDLLLRNAADSLHGGYYENLQRDWQPAGDGPAAGDRKSLDIHMHLLEAFAELVRLSGDSMHRQRLREIRDLLCSRFIDPSTGAGGNQYSLDFRPKSPITIDRTWIAERPGSQPQQETRPANLTSYGHNLELAWLLGDADRTLGEPGHSDQTISGLVRHSFERGYDQRHGGVFREGPADALPSDRDKEFWQNAEALVGFLEGYRVSQDEALLQAFCATWRFAREHLVHPRFGEWRVRGLEDGTLVVGDLGNPWKNAYHSGRAAMESLDRLDSIIRLLG